MQSNKKAVNKAKINAGFTLIEVLVVIAIIAILAAIVLVAINPAKRFQDARNSQRKANVESILSALQQNMVDNKGILTGCPALTSTPTKIGVTSGEIDLLNGGSSCISSYLAVLPVDPKNGTWTDTTHYETDYEISQNASNQITITAPDASSDGGGTISVTR